MCSFRTGLIGRSDGRLGSGRLLGRKSGQILRPQYADEFPLRALVLEEHDAVSDCEERVIFGAVDVFPRLVARAALADQDASAGYQLPAKSFDAEPLAVRVASVCR